MKNISSPREILLLLFFTLLGFAVMGYHPGLEDDGIYLTAIKADLNPALYPHNPGFFRIQTQATLFDRAMAQFIKATHMPVAWAELLWQLACLFAILWACHGVAGRLFAERRAQWAGVAMVAAMFTLPVSGTALYIADQHLHPRNVATALILLAILRVWKDKKTEHKVAFDDRRWQAIPLLFAAFLMHPLMATMGISICIFIGLALTDPVYAAALAWGRQSPRALRKEAAALIPLGWVFEPATPMWRDALKTRTYYYLYRWTWYEWLGALAPLFLFWLMWRVAEKRRQKPLARFALAVFAYGVFQQAIAMILLAPRSWVRLTPLQPMRYLQLIYIFMALVAGCLVGKYLLKASTWHWAAYLLLINAGMFAWQLALYPGSRHLELPGEQPANPWLQAFAWIRQNTPENAYFALDPYYLKSRGEDYHSFRALAERSQLADAVKDAAVVTQIPELAATWTRQVGAEKGWTHFNLDDFERLKTEFGVNWVLVSYSPPLGPQTSGLACDWHNGTLAVCEIP